MKNLFLTIALLVSVVSFGQITKTEKLGNIRLSYSELYSISNGDAPTNKLFYVMYRDSRYQYIKEYESFSLGNKDEALAKVNHFIEFLETYKKDSSVSEKIGDIRISTDRMLGSSYLNVVTEKAIMNITKGELLKLKEKIEIN